MIRVISPSVKKLARCSAALDRLGVLLNDLELISRTGPGNVCRDHIRTEFCPHHFLDMLSSPQRSTPQFVFSNPEENCASNVAKEPLRPVHENGANVVAKRSSAVRSVETFFTSTSTHGMCFHTRSVYRNHVLFLCWSFCGHCFHWHFLHWNCLHWNFVRQAKDFSPLITVEVEVHALEQ